MAQLIFNKYLLFSKSNPCKFSQFNSNISKRKSENQIIFKIKNYFIANKYLPKTLKIFFFTKLLLFKYIE